MKWLKEYLLSSYEVEPPSDDRVKRSGIEHFLSSCIFACVASRPTGQWCGQVVSVISLYSDDPSSNRAEAYSFFCKSFS